MLLCIIKLDTSKNVIINTFIKQAVISWTSKLYCSDNYKYVRLSESKANFKMILYKQQGSADTRHHAYSNDVGKLGSRRSLLFSRVTVSIEVRRMDAPLGGYSVEEKRAEVRLSKIHRQMLLQYGVRTMNQQVGRTFHSRKIRYNGRKPVWLHIKNAHRRTHLEGGCLDWVRPANHVNASGNNRWRQLWICMSYSSWRFRVL